MHHSEYYQKFVVMLSFEIKIHRKYLRLFSSCTLQHSISPDLIFLTSQRSTLLPDLLYQDKIQTLKLEVTIFPVFPNSNKYSVTLTTVPSSVSLLFRIALSIKDRDLFHHAIDISPYMYFAVRYYRLYNSDTKHELAYKAPR